MKRSWIASALGAWLVIAPFALGYTGISSGWSDITVGFLIAVMAGWAALAKTGTVAVTSSSVVAVAGLWVAIASFVFAHLPPTAVLWNDVIVGVAVLGLGAAGAVNPGVRRQV
jgi:hypothetical protein